MDYLIRALDGNPGLYRPPNVPPLPTSVDPGLVHNAQDFLKQSNLSLKLRETWPTDGMPIMNVQGRIPLNHQAQAGRVLCVWGDVGWGPLVRQGKYRDGRYHDDLVNACGALVREWSPGPAPEWVTCIPSRRHPNLVPDFVRRLAAALNLPFNPILEKADDRRPQKEMQNNSQQARNIDGSFALTGSIPKGPVLLVDDMVDSRWTLTVAAFLLRSNGSDRVYPFAIASTKHAE
jgi:ATP-dependent DNA helicase RecQ